MRVWQHLIFSVSRQRMKQHRGRALALSVLIGVVLPAVVSGQTVYEGFDVSGLFDGEPLGSAVGASSTGFAPGSSWSFLQGTGTATFQQAGLAYMDSEGNELATADGALRVVPQGDALLARALATGLDIRPDTYWVSYLMRLDAPDPGDLFWTPDTTWQVAAAGLQGTHDFRFVNGNFARDDVGLIQASQGQSHLVVVQITRAEGDGSSDTAQLWIDPLLTDPGPAHALHQSTSFFDSIRDATDYLMLFGERFGSEYTVDEFRIAESFELVAPVAGGQNQVCGDFDSDGDIDAGDFTIVILGWTGGLEPGVGERLFGDGDCDGDGDVDASDLTSVIIGWTGSQAGLAAAQHYASIGPHPADHSGGHLAVAVPEPSGWITALAALTLLLVRRRRG